MYINGIVQIGTAPANEYLFHFHETYESGKFYYLRLAVPILSCDTSVSYMTTYVTFRTDIDNSEGSFRNNVRKDGIDYEVICVSNQKDKLIICNDDNFEEKFKDFLEMFVDDSSYRNIPEINKFLDNYPELKI